MLWQLNRPLISVQTSEELAVDDSGCVVSVNVSVHSDSKIALFALGTVHRLVRRRSV